MENFKGFEDEEVQEGTVSMGSSVGAADTASDTDELRIEEAVTEEKDERSLQEFKNFCGDRPYLVFDKKDIAHFLDLLSYHSRLGYDHYTMSFKLDTGKLNTGKIDLVYNNGNVLALSEVAVTSSGNVQSQIISIDTFLRVYSVSRGYLFIYEDEGNLYSYAFGGRVYLETLVLVKDICTKEHLVEQLNSKPTKQESVPMTFISTLKTLYEIIRTGTRIEEKAIYFKGEDTFIYSGIVTGKFPGFGVDLVLQDLDISTLARFFFDVTGTITISDHEIFLKFSYGGRNVFLAKRGLTLSDDMKHRQVKSNDFVSVNMEQVLTIVGFLINLPNNTGVLDISVGSQGLNLVCFQKAMENNSSFKVNGHVSGSGIGDIKLNLDTMKTFLRVFKSQVELRSQDNKLHVSGPEGEMTVFGNM